MKIAKLYVISLLIYISILIGNPPKEYLKWFSYIVKHWLFTYNVFGVLIFNILYDILYKNYKNFAIFLFEQKESDLI